MLKRSVIVVDNDDAYRRHLVEQLQNQGIDSVGVPTGEEAVEIITNDPQRFRFAVVDHALNGGWDGIETTRRLTSLNQSLFVLVYSNVPSDKPQDVARYEYEALAAGAYRYLKRSYNEQRQLIEVFMNEIEQLISLSDWVRQYYGDRATVPSLLTQLDVGVDIIDQSHRVWFMNNAMRRIILGSKGITTQDTIAIRQDQMIRFPGGRCSTWHGYRFCPCPNCLVEKTFNTAEPKDSIFLSPLPLRDQDALFYLRVWSQPVRDESNNVVRAINGHPLAVMESVHDMTGSDQLRTMSLRERLGIIAGSLYNRAPEESYVFKRCFNQVKIFHRMNAAREYALEAVAGYGNELKIGGPVNIAVNNNLSNAQKTGTGMLFKESGPDPQEPTTSRDAYILWPVMDSGKMVAYIEVNVVNDNRDLIALVEPYAREVLFAIRDSEKYINNELAKVEAQLVDIEQKLQAEVSSPEEALRMLALEACQRTCSEYGILRYSQNEECFLLRLGIPGHDSYENVANLRYSLTNLNSWSVRTIISGQEQTAKRAQNAEVFEAIENDLSNDVTKLLIKKVKSVCFQPLLLEGHCIGAFGLLSTNGNTFNKNETLAMVRSLAKKMALALHDFLVARDVEKRVETIQNETFGLILHSLHTPLDGLNTDLDLLSGMLKKDQVNKTHALEAVDRAQIHASQIARTRVQFLSLQKPWKERIEKIDLDKLIQAEIDQCCLEFSGIKQELRIQIDLQQVLIDVPAVKACLDVLIRNALDALVSLKQDGKEVEVILRNVSVDEQSLLGGEPHGIAIDVQDNGLGVHPEIRKDLFKVIRSTKALGLGFGLALCRKIANSAHGDVYYNDNNGKGAWFTLVIPYYAQSEVLK